MKKILLLFAVAMIYTSPAFAMTITSMDTAENMVQSIGGSGVTISNVAYTGANAASGYFTGGVAAGIGIESGIVLTSGFAANLNGTTNIGNSISGDNGVAGDSELNGLIPGYSTYDATILEFDFQTSGDAVFFNYSFGSDEYNEYVDSQYNDVFGFFMDGINYAVIPGTSNAVSINNVNNDSNASFYNSNENEEFAFEYDGFTDVFMASFTNLNADQVYHIKLAIADAGDFALDSGVFIEAGSFSDTPDNPVPEPATMLLFGLGLLGLAGVSRKK